MRSSARNWDKDAMTTHVAHSEHAGKTFDRHLRRDVPFVVRYGCGMQMRIKELRQERGWTVDHLASLVGMSRSYVSEIENGKKPANALRIQKFADAFGLKVFELLSEDSLSKDQRTLLDRFEKMGEKEREALLVLSEKMAE